MRQAMRLTEQQRQRAEQWRRYAAAIAGKYWRVYGGDENEWQSEAMLALLTATVKWDASRGENTWVSCLWWRLTAALNRHRRVRKNCGITRMPWRHPAVQANESMLAELPDRTSHRSSVEMRELMDEARGRLQERELAVLDLRFHGAEKLSDIGKRLGVSKERVRQLQGGALAKIASVLRQNEVDYVCC